MISKKNIKPLALYFPQFHEFEENNRFWGKGFTEWDNLKSWRPFFENHIIKKPLWGEYNLLDESILNLQCDYAKRIGIYGFVHYHYWFDSIDEGKVMYKVTEKYADSEFALPFCLMWANEPWTKRWDGEEGDTLISQGYTNRDYWRRHADYLISMFKKEKYIKVDNMPVFFVYMIQDISSADEMFKYLKKRVVEAGFKDLYLVESLSHKYPNKSTFSAVKRVCDFNPNYLNTMGNHPVVKRGSDFFVFDTNKRFSQISEMYERYDKDKIPCVFSGWDASPRAKGRVAHIETLTDPKSFEKMLKSVCESMPSRKDDNFLLMFAWNEWGEGAVLEPDDINGFDIGNACKRVFKEGGDL